MVQLALIIIINLFAEGRVGSTGNSAVPTEFDLTNGKPIQINPSWMSTFTRPLSHVKVVSDGIFNCGGNGNKICYKQFFGTPNFVDQSMDMAETLNNAASSQVMGGIFVTPGQRVSDSAYIHQPQFFNGQKWNDEIQSGVKYASTLHKRGRHCQVTISPTQVMVFGGLIPGNLWLREVERYDFTTNTWTPLAPFTDEQTK